MKKAFMITFIFFIMTIPINSYAMENNQTIDEIMTEELGKYDLSGLEKLGNGFNGYNEILGERTVYDLVLDFASGKAAVNIEDILNVVFKKIIQGMSDTITNMSMILFTVVICGLLKNMYSKGLSDISEICEYICFIVVVSMLLNTFFSYVHLTSELIMLVQAFIRVIFPPLLTLMTAVGSISSVSIFQPAMAVLSGSMIEFMSNLIMPIGVLGGVTGILSGVSNKIKLSKMSDFCNSISKWMIGISSTIFVGILSIQGIMVATYDGISIRTAKYTVDSFVPIIGGMMSDTVDTVLGCSLLLKNAIGFTGLIVISSICLLPIIRYITCILSYKLLGTILDMTIDSKTASAVNGLVNAVTFMFAIISVIAVMTFITVALAINAGNTNAMLR